MAVSKLLRTATSDVWMIPYDMAGSYKQRDIIVLGDQRALTLDIKVSSPGEAFRAFREMEDVSVVNSLRHGIEKVIECGVQVHGQGTLADVESIDTVEKGRTFIEQVMSRADLPRFFGPRLA
jgi:hypothetical protein